MIVSVHTLCDNKGGLESVTAQHRNYTNAHNVNHADRFTDLSGQTVQIAVFPENFQEAKRHFLMIASFIVNDLGEETITQVALEQSQKIK